MSFLYHFHSSMITTLTSIVTVLFFLLGVLLHSSLNEKDQLFFHLDCNNFSLAFIRLCLLILLSSPKNSLQSTEVNNELMQCRCCKVLSIFVSPKGSADRSLRALLCAIQHGRICISDSKAHNLFLIPNFHK